MTGTQGQLGKVSRTLTSTSRDGRPVRVLLAAQSYGTDLPDLWEAVTAPGGEVSWVEVSLTAEPSGRPTLELRHSAQVEDERWREFGPGAVGIGWDTTLLGLAQHLGADLGVGPSNAAAWMASDDGKQFITRSGQHWQAAAVAAGEEPGQAAAAAHRCIAAYTGEPPG
jgi:hypothetical protein